MGENLVDKNYPKDTASISWIEDFIDPKFLAVISLDFLKIAVYTSNNLKTVDNCSTLWKRYVILMSIRHWLQLQEMLKRRKSRLFHPIDGPGVVHSKNLLPHLTFRDEEFFLPFLVSGCALQCRQVQSFKTV